MTELNPGFELPRVVIENITPILDGGRYPVKRTVGSVVEVRAHIFKDGHDLIGARVIHRVLGDGAWQAVPLQHHYEADYWFGSFRADRLGRVEYAVQAWPDHYGTFRSELEKRLNAGQDVRPELVEGAALIARYALQFSGDAAAFLEKCRRELADPDLNLDERLKTALLPELKSLIAGPMAPNEIAQHAVLEMIVDRLEATFSAWYELFPRSQSPVPGNHGTFADTLRRLPEIAAQGFDVIYLPPIHPIGEVHRKGRNNARVAEPGITAARGRSAPNSAGTTPYTRSSARSRTSRPSSKARRTSASRSRSTSPSSAHPITPGCGSTPTGSSSVRTARSATRRILPRSTKTSTR